jgi:PIN domain nuclease of toxin-antitoxin system
VIVLDTHAWLWWLTAPAKLGKRAARVLKRADRIGLPAICVWEIAMKASVGKLRFDRPYETWIDAALAADPRIEVCPLSPRVAVAAVQLSWNHGDPADRFIVATARVHDTALVTSDARIHDARLVRCVWD